MEEAIEIKIGGTLTSQKRNNEKNVIFRLIED